MSESVLRVDGTARRLPDGDLDRVRTSRSSSRPARCSASSGESGQRQDDRRLALLGYTRAGAAHRRRDVTCRRGRSSDRERARAARAARAARSRTCRRIPGGAEPRRPDRRSVARDAAGARPRAQPWPERGRGVLERVSTCRPTATFLRRFPHQLSGGQQQRVVIAHGARLRPAAGRARRADYRARRRHAGADDRGDRAPAGASAASPSSTSPTTSRSSRRSPTGSRSCTPAGSSRRARRAELLARAAPPVHAPA